MRKGDQVSHSLKIYARLENCTDHGYFYAKGAHIEYDGDRLDMPEEHRSKHFVYLFNKIQKICTDEKLDNLELQYCVYKSGDVMFGYDNSGGGTAEFKKRYKQFVLDPKCAGEVQACLATFSTGYQESLRPSAPATRSSRKATLMPPVNDAAVASAVDASAAVASEADQLRLS